MGVTITQSASSASRAGSGQSHEIALMATKKSHEDDIEGDFDEPGLTEADMQTQAAAAVVRRAQGLAEADKQAFERQNLGIK